MNRRKITKKKYFILVALAFLVLFLASLALRVVGSLTIKDDELTKQSVSEFTASVSEKVDIPSEFLEGGDKDKANKIDQRLNNLNEYRQIQPPEEDNIGKNNPFQAPEDEDVSQERVDDGSGEEISGAEISEEDNFINEPVRR